MKQTLILISAAAVTLFGCGRSDLPELGTVSGVVTLDGQPLSDAIVTFTPTDKGRPSAGQTDDEGRYTLLYVPDVEGALIGQHSVTVRFVVTDEMEEDDSQAGQPTLPTTASDGSIVKDVEAGHNEIPVELVSDK